MKIALVSRIPHKLDRPRGGVETVTLALTAALTAMDGIDVHVVTVERGQRRLEVVNGLGATVHRLPGSCWPQILDIIAGPGRRRLKRYLCWLSPDIVHFHETYGLCIGPLPVPRVFTVHGFDHANLPAERRPLAGLRAPLWKRVEAWGLARQRHIISITPYVRQHIRPLTNAAIYDVDNPIDPACFEVQRNEIPGRVFFAGWISHRKNPLTLVRAFARVVGEGVEGTLHLAGEESDPAYAENLRKTVHELGLTGHVKLLGRISPSDIRRQLGEASVFALPARQENAPMAISEALAAGVPVISSNACGMPFMIRDGETGFLVDPENPALLADRLMLLLRNGDLRARIGRAARASARERFHPESVARKTRAVYDEVLSSSGGRATAPPVSDLSEVHLEVNQTHLRARARNSAQTVCTQRDRKWGGISLRKFTYPFHAALAICSDLDGTADRRTYWTLARFLNTTHDSIMGPGLGLEVGNSIFFRAPAHRFSYWGTDDHGRHMVRAMIQSGHIDCLHSYGALAARRADARQAIDELEHHACNLRVWVDHSTAPSNFGPDIMGGHGDVPGDPAYHADLTVKYGIRYVWRGRTTVVTGQDAPVDARALMHIFRRRHPFLSSYTFLKAAAKITLGLKKHSRWEMYTANKSYQASVLRDGQALWEFLRANPFWAGPAHGETAVGIADVITEPMLAHLVRRQGVCILYTHLGKKARPDVPFGLPAQEALRRLARFHRDGNILVTTTHRLLRYLTVRDHLRFLVRPAEGRLVITIDRIEDPVLGVRRPTREDVNGMTFVVPKATDVAVRLWDGTSVDHETLRAMNATYVTVPWRPLVFPEL